MWLCTLLLVFSRKLGLLMYENQKPFKLEGFSKQSLSAAAGDLILEDRQAQEAMAEDGYNWRKYWQKQSGENLRSYHYYCTYPNCKVKKNVECNADGVVTMIVYKGGDHKHSKPDQPDRQFSTDVLNEEIKNEPIRLCDSPQPAFDGIELNFKRIKVEACATDLESTSKAQLEPMIVIQTISEVDLLDDGYQWRKYGQRTGKGSLNPRNYFRCTYSRCSVRKYAERSSSNEKAVITTYEGRHNHEVPADYGS